MKKFQPYIILYVITLAFRIATALPLEQAGYMDASYTIHIAENLARGRGFVEDVLWNYLDQPAGLPHPSNLYWMPLPAILVAPFFVLFGVSYRVAQIPFIILSSFLPLFAFYLSHKIFARDAYAWAAGLFTTFSGFYTIYWVSPDNFTVYALTASLCLFFITRGLETNAEELGRSQAQTSADKFFFIAGLFAALSHLARADGLLLLAIAPLSLLLCALRSSRNAAPLARHLLFSTLYFLLGYLFLMSPWFARNYSAVGAVLPSAGTKTMWLTHYDELFRFADDLTPARYLMWGASAIIGSKVNGAVQNFFILLFASLQLFLAPFALIGLWQSRRRVEFLPAMLYVILLGGVLTVVFTFPSWRGTLLHSSVALVPFFAVAAPPGIDAAVEWIARRRRAWNVRQATGAFRVGFIALAIFFSVYLYSQGVWGSLFGNPMNVPLWNQRDAHYPAIACWLDQNANADDIVMVVDPPSFYNISHRRAIAIPTDDVNAVLVAAQRYRARYVIVEYDHPRPLEDLYKERAIVAGLKRVADFRDGMNRPAMLYEIVE